MAGFLTDQVVTVQSDGGTGHGIKVANDYVLTVAHMLVARGRIIQEGNNFKVNIWPDTNFKIYDGQGNTYAADRVIIDPFLLI